MNAPFPAKSLLAALALAALAPVAAQPDEKALRNTEIEAVRLMVENDGDNAYFIFSEDVVLYATNLVVECDQLEIFATRETQSDSDIGEFGAIKEVIATGRVRIVQEERVATCDKAIVQPRLQRIVLTGNAVVQQPGGRLVTESPEDEIILDRGNGRITIDTKGPRKFRFIGSPIRDLGFEQQSPVPTEAPATETEADTEAESETAPPADPVAPATEAPAAP